MNEKESDGPCEKCGYSNDAPYLPSYLAPGTILNDRYIVGKLLSYNGEGATYIGFDKVTGAKVTVKEYMPDTLCSRKKGDPQIVVDANRLPLYKTYMSEFVELNKALLIGNPTAAPAGLTCLKDAAAGRPVASFNSFTNCQLLKASRKLI